MPYITESLPKWRDLTPWYIYTLSNAIDISPIVYIYMYDRSLIELIFSIRFVCSRHLSPIVGQPNFFTKHVRTQAMQVKVSNPTPHRVRKFALGRLAKMSQILKPKLSIPKFSGLAAGKSILYIIVLRSAVDTPSGANKP